MSTVFGERQATAGKSPPTSDQDAVLAMTSEPAANLESMLPGPPILIAPARATTPLDPRRAEPADIADASVNQQLRPPPAVMMGTPVAFHVGTPSLGSARLEHL